MSARGRVPRVVIVGGGFAGAYCAQALEKKSKHGEVEIVLIDRNNFFVFSPLLVEAGTGNLEPRHCVVPLRSFLKRGSFRMGEVTGVDFENKRVHYRTGRTGAEGLEEHSPGRQLDYDHLVLAPGSVTRLPPVPGLQELGCQMKSLADAVGLRDRAVAMLEAADTEPDADRRRALLHFVVVGSNFTGVEVAGEYEMFLRRAAKSYANLKPQDIQVTLVERDDRILPALDPDLARYARARLERRGVTVRLHTTVTAISEGEATLDTDETLEAHTVIWCAGIAPPPLVSSLGLPTTSGGYIDCEGTFRVRGHDRVWAIGDAAFNPDPQGTAYPATAQHAVRQGARLAENLLRVLRGEEPRALDYRPLGSLVALGCRSGVAEIMGLKISGFAAWWMYRTVYLLKMPGLSRKVRVALDWSIDLIFTPDVVQLGVHR